MPKISFYLYIFIFLLAPSVSSQEEVEQEIPAEILFKDVKRHGFSISPNGKFFSEIITNNVQNDIVVVDIDGYKLLNQIPMEERDIEAVHWITNSRLLYESKGAIYAIDIDGTNKKQIVDRRSDVKQKGRYAYFRGMRYNNLLSTLPSKEHLILIETYDLELNSSIKEVNIFTGKKYTVIHGEKYDIQKWILDHDLVIRLGVRYGDDGYEYFEYDAEKEKLRPFKVNIEGVEYKVNVKGESFLKQVLTFEGFSLDPNVIYLTSTINSDKRKLISYDIKKQEVIEVLAEDINCDIKEPHDDSLGFIYDYKDRIVAGLRYEGIVPQFKWFGQRIADIHKKLNETFPGFIHDFVDSDTSGDRFVIYQWSDLNEGNIGIYDATNNSYAVMFQFNEELNKYKLSKTRSFVIEARDGHKIPCYINLPNNYNGETSIPMVVIPHGGPWVRDYWRADPSSQFFTSRGYATLRVNFRGSTGFGKEHLLAGINNIDEIMIDDIVDAVRSTKTSYAIDTVFLYGHSYGGYATYMGLIKYPEDFAGGVAISAPSDIKEWMKYIEKTENTFAYDLWEMALGSKKTKYLKKISPLSYTDMLNKPLLMFHGEYDRVIPLEHAVEMESKLKKNGHEVVLEIIQNEGHSFEDAHVMAYILTSSDTFFKEILEE